MARDGYLEKNMNEIYHMNERHRLEFLEWRDGKEGAIAFARRTFASYGAALKTPYGRVYRRTLVCSRVVFRQYLRAANEY
jgi:hypothetical protein